MIKQFTEIDDFFKKERFNKNELIKLLNLIPKKYSNIKDVKLAYSLVELQLLKFDILKNESKTINKNKENVNGNKKQTNKLKENKTSNKLKNNAIEKNNNFKDVNLLSFLNQLTETESKEKFLKILKQKGIYKGRLNIIVTIEVYNDIKEQLQTLMQTNKEKDQSLRVKMSKKKKTSKSNSVYELLKSTKSVGKIIYIRAK